MKQRVWYLVECWMLDEGFVPVGVWYFIEHRGLDFWFYPEYDVMVKDLDIVGPYSQQLANRFAALAMTEDLDINDPALLGNYRKTGGQRIDRIGPFEIEVDEFDPEQLIEFVRTGEAVDLRQIDRLFRISSKLPG